MACHVCTWGRSRKWWGIFVVSDFLWSHLQHFAFNSSWLQNWAFSIAPFAPHGKTTSIYKKKSKSFIENEKSWSNLKLAPENFWDREIFENFSFEFVWKWKILRSKISKNFRSKKFRNFHWKLYENENRSFSTSKIFRCQL